MAFQEEARAPLQMAALCELVIIRTSLQQEAMLSHCLAREQERKKKQISIQEKIQNEVFYYWGRLQRTGIRETPRSITLCSCVCLGVPISEPAALEQ